MDRFHRAVRIDSSSGRPCQFCKALDPDFATRKTADQMVHERDTACGHLTENGHVRHRLLELKGKLAEKDLRAPQLVA